jgi:hypothetical protein
MLQSEDFTEDYSCEEREELLEAGHEEDPFEVEASRQGTLTFPGLDEAFS